MPSTHRGWWERDPERLAAELESLDRNGIRYERDAEAESQGIIRLHLWYPIPEGGEQYLIATFPDHYPFFRFEVEAPDINLPYHQHARSDHLCLLPRRTDFWLPEDLLGDVLHSQLTRVLTIGGQQAVSSELSDQEEHQAEPYSDYYEYERGAILLIDSEWSIPKEAHRGSLRIGLENDSNLVRGAVLEVTDERGSVLARSPEKFASIYKLHVEGGWVRFDSPPSAKLRSPEVYKESREKDVFGVPRKQPVQGGSIEVRGVLFPEEIRWRGISDGAGDGWLFVVRFEPERPSKKKKRSSARRNSVHAAPESLYYLVRAGRAGRSDLMARIPELLPLSQRCVAQFGLGCLGAPSSLEFARAGLGELRILDHDFVEPGSVVRWPIGLTAAGHPKAQKLLKTIMVNYPHTKVMGCGWKIGATRGSGQHESEILSEMLDGADLVYDATAEYGVQRFLAFIARERSVPYVGLHSTPGGWGGVVVRIRPGVTAGCWQCLQWAIADGLIPTPSFDVRGDQLQPAGCADPTYTGANFDLMEVAMAGVRATVSTLCGGREGAYPEMDWDIAVLGLRDNEGRLIAPTWRYFALDRHPQCEACGVLVA